MRVLPPFKTKYHTAIIPISVVNSIFFFSVEIGLVGILHFCVKGEQRETQNFE